MRRFVVVLIAVVAMILPLTAQNTGNKVLNIIYVAHSTRTQTDKLIERLREEFERSRTSKNPTVFYLTNGRAPIIVQMNTAKDNRKDFGEIIYRLQSMRAHSVNAQTDVNTLIKLFDELNVLSEENKPMYQKVEWTYYIDSSYWQAKYNESVIEKLYWVLDMHGMEAMNYLRVNIYHGSKDRMPIDKNAPFGAKNLCRNMRFNPLPY